MLRLVAQRRMRLTATPLALAAAAFAVGSSGFIATLDSPNYSRALSPLPELKWDVAMAQIGPQLEPFPGPVTPMVDLAATIDAPTETKATEALVRYSTPGLVSAAGNSGTATALPDVPAATPRATAVPDPAHVEIPDAVLSAAGGASRGQVPAPSVVNPPKTPVAQQPTNTAVPPRPAGTAVPVVPAVTPIAEDDGNNGRGNDDKEKSKPEKGASDDAGRGNSKK